MGEAPGPRSNCMLRLSQPIHITGAPFTGGRGVHSTRARMEARPGVPPLMLDCPHRVIALADLWLWTRKIRAQSIWDVVRILRITTSRCSAARMGEEAGVRPTPDLDHSDFLP